MMLTCLSLLIMIFHNTITMKIWKAILLTLKELLQKKEKNQQKVEDSGKPDCKFQNTGPMFFLRAL